MYQYKYTIYLNEKDFCESVELTLEDALFKVNQFLGYGRLGAKKIIVEEIQVSRSQTFAKD
jgi:hypothetical protein